MEIYNVGYLAIGDRVLDSTQERWGTVAYVDWAINSEGSIDVATIIDWSDGSIAGEAIYVPQVFSWDMSVAIERLMTDH